MGFADKPAAQAINGFICILDSVNANAAAIKL